MDSARFARRISDPSPRTVDPRGASGRAGSSALGEFLRSRRMQVDLDSADILVDHRRRQVRGLRREEVAELARISTDYYTRLEQGRERRPSAQVLGAIARVLRLDDGEVRHLYLVAGQVPPSPTPGPEHELSADLESLLHPALMRVPVAVLGPALNIVTLNPAAVAFYSAFSRTDNLLDMVFCDAAARSFYAEWDPTARAMVANMRYTSAQFPDDPQIDATKTRLSASSEHFARLWSVHEVRQTPCPMTHLIHHPVVGDLHLYCNLLAVVSAPGQWLHVYAPQAGSRSAHRVDQLAITSR